MSSKYTTLGDYRVKQIKSNRTRWRKGHAVGIEDAFGRFQSAFDIHLLAVCGCDLDKLGEKLIGEVV